MWDWCEGSYTNQWRVQRVQKETHTLFGQLVVQPFGQLTQTVELPRQFNGGNRLFQKNGVRITGICGGSHES